MIASDKTAHLPHDESRGRSYCLIHRKYFETSWCPDCDKKGKCIACKLVVIWR
ncbi:hypothetical protein BC940DRAFT_246304 [Gongronella butleri]|nr:hypothetical protein BC940DRAFT_246304 [Gongronella butleri]